MHLHFLRKLNYFGCPSYDFLRGMKFLVIEFCTSVVIYILCAAVSLVQALCMSYYAPAPLPQLFLINFILDLQQTPKDKKASLVIHGLVDKVLLIWINIDLWLAIFV